MTVELKTYQDIYDALTLAFDVSGTTNAHKARYAIQKAYRELPLRHPWYYFNRNWSFKSVAPYSTGTITYTHSTKTVTLSGGTFPSWAANGSIKLGSDETRYPVNSRTDDTTLVLDQPNPGADIAAGATFEIVRNRYPLPCDFHRMKTIIDRTGNYELAVGSSTDAMAADSYFSSTSIPTGYTIDADHRYLDSLQLRLIPTPSSAREYSYTYKAKPRELRVYLENTGTVSNSSTTATFSSAVLTSHHVGCVLRFGDASNAPTGLAGATPYQEYRIIASVDSTTQATLDSAPSATYSTVNYTLSDPVDIDTEVMFNALISCAEFEYARVSQREDLGPRASIMQEQLRIAAASDARIIGPESGIPSPWGLAGWSTVPTETVT